MSAMYTPGPWHVGYYLTQWAAFQSARPSEPLAVMTPHNAEANAGLIAAAPELAEALRNTRDAIKRLSVAMFMIPDMDKEQVMLAATDADSLLARLDESAVAADMR